MIFDKILYINLDRRPDRNKNVIDQLTKLNWMEKTERIEAIDGNIIDYSDNNNEITKYVTPNGITDALNGKTVYTTLTKGGIGCALSHRKCYENIVINNIKKCLILEDDCYIDNNIINKLNEIENNVPPNYDILFLGYHSAHIARLDNYDIYYIKPIKIYGLFGYIVTLDGAKKLLEYVFPITLQIDSEMPQHFDKINTYALTTKNTVIYSDRSALDTKFGTDIQIRENFTNNNIIDYNYNDNDNIDYKNENNKKYMIIIIIIIFLIIISIIVFKFINNGPIIFRNYFRRN